MVTDKQHNHTSITEYKAMWNNIETTISSSADNNNNNPWVLIENVKIIGRVEGQYLESKLEMEKLV